MPHNHQDCDRPSLVQRVGHPAVCQQAICQQTISYLSRFIYPLVPGLSLLRFQLQSHSALVHVLKVHVFMV